MFEIKRFNKSYLQQRQIFDGLAGYTNLLK